MQRFNRLTSKYGRNRALAYFTRRGRKTAWSKKTGLRYSKGMKKVTGTTKMPFGRTKLVNQHIDGTLLAERSFMPPSLVTKHRYVERLTLYNENTTGITGNEVAFRLGSLFDPNFTGGGHQPWGYDQMVLLYQQYQVYKVKVAVRVHWADGPQPFLAVNVRPNSSAYNLQSKFMYEIIERNNNTAVLPCATSTGNQVDKTWEAEYYLADIEGLSRLEYSNDLTYKGLSSGNPTKSPTLSVVCGSAEPTPGCTVKLHVELEYYCKWSSPVNPGES